jgi:predicted pyridoxine 5'-phosphate oxidase superfamily flavin-nucleotide-binding protein
MDPVRVRIIMLGKGYLAESRVPFVTATGSSAEEAVENARLIALGVSDTTERPSDDEMLIVRIDEPNGSTIVMQPIRKPFSLDAVRQTHCS